MQSAQRCRRRELCASTGDFENVGFVFTDFLYFLAGVNGANDQGGLCRLGGLGGQKQCGLMRKLPEKSFDAAFEARLGEPVSATEKEASTRKLPLPGCTL